MVTALSSGGFNATVSPTNNPLVARYTITVPDGSQVSIQFGLTTAYGTSTWQVDAPAGGGQVSILVAGMLPSMTYHWRRWFTCGREQPWATATTRLRREHCRRSICQDYR
jgi:hypothetical protein